MQSKPGTIVQRLLAVLLILLMLVSMTACGDGEKDVHSPAGGTTTSGGSSNNSSNSGNPSSGTTDPDGGSSDVPAGVAAMKALLPSTERVDLRKGTWVDCGAYSYIKLPNVKQSAVGEYHVDALPTIDFYTHSGEVSRGNALIKYSSRYNAETRKDDLICQIHNSEENFLVLVVGEMPHSYYLWRLGGLTDEEIGNLRFEGAIEDHIPFENQSDVNLNYSTHAGDSAQRYYRVGEVDQSRLDGFLAAMTAEGYIESKRETRSDGKLYYEALKRTDKDLPIYLCMQLMWSDNQIILCFVRDTELRTQDDMIAKMAGNTPQNGRPPEESKTQLNTKLDFTTATEEALANGKVYLFSKMDMTALFDYLDQLETEGYREMDSPYVPDVFPNRGPDEPNVWLSKEGAGDKSCIFLYGNGYENLIAVFTAAEVPADIREHDLWRKVKMFIQPGIGYLETVTNQYVADYGYPGSGRGWDSSGYISYYGAGDADDLDREAKNLLNEGFTLHQVVEANGLTHTIYKRNEDFSGFRYTIYARLVLDGDFFEIEFGYGFRDTTHKNR